MRQEQINRSAQRRSVPRMDETAYLWEQQQAEEAVRKAKRTAKRAKSLVAEANAFLERI